MPTSMAIATIGAAAFQAMELAPFSSFADDTPQAQDAASAYPIARRMCIEACDWSFASAVVNLPEIVVANAPVDPSLPYAFALPGDCVIFRHTLDLDVRWRLDGRILRADWPGPLPVRYTRDIDNENSMPATFQTALALRLAAMLSPRWVGADSKTASLEQRAEVALKQAMRQDARSASLERYDGEPWGIESWSDWSTGRPRLGRGTAVRQPPTPAPPVIPATDYVAIYQQAKS